MHTLKTIFIFYQKLFTPTLLLSGLVAFIGLAITGEFSLKTVGISFIFLGIFFHYFIYEIKNSNEYYFYYNLGLSRLNLWLITLTLNLIIGLSLILL